MRKPHSPGQLVRAALLVATQERGTLAREEAASFNATVVNRLKAEQDTSWLARLEVMFADMRLGYAGVGAAVATMICVVIMPGMMRFATIERPDSLAAIVTFLATPGSNENPVPMMHGSCSRARSTGRLRRAKTTRAPRWTPSSRWPRS
jgi:hypothetical protein